MVSLILISVAGILNAVMDNLNFHEEYNVFSWTNKYASPLRPAPRNFYYRILRIQYKEKFPLSTTVMVFITDKWHFVQFIFLTVIVTAIVMHSPITSINSPVLSLVVDFIILKSAFSLFKQITLSKLLP